jgi:RNA polymerase sigma factor (sigma-70 family)
MAVSSADTAHAIESSLVVAAQAGETASFETLVRRHIDRLYGAARLMLRDTDLAEDAVQRALVRAWRDLPALRDPARFEAWLQKLLVRSCYDEARRKRRWLGEVRLIDRVTEHIENEERAIEERDQIERAFRTLSPEHRAVLVLHFYLDLPPTEIAGRLNLPAGTARSRLHYALSALRGALEAQERGGRRDAGGVA